MPGFKPATQGYEEGLTTYFMDGKVVEDSHLVASLPPEERAQIILAGYYHSNGLAAYVFIGDMLFLQQFK